MHRLAALLLWVFAAAGVAVDAAGDVYVTDSAADAVYQVRPSGTETTVSSGLDVPNGVALDGLGNLYVADTFNKKVTKIDRADAPSLKFDPTKINLTSKDSPKTVDVENIGNASLNFSALTYPPDFPEASGENECTSSTSLASGSTCALIIDFSPVTTFKGSSRLLKEVVKLTTNDLKIAKKAQQVKVRGVELEQ